MTTLTAAQRRAILANAHAAFLNATPGYPIERNAALNDALLTTGFVERTDNLCNFRLEGTTVCVTVDADDFQEGIELDAYGNILKGTI
jgi:hypothetical protein